MIYEDIYSLLIRTVGDHLEVELHDKRGDIIDTVRVISIYIPGNIEFVEADANGVYIALYEPADFEIEDSKLSIP